MKQNNNLNGTNHGWEPVGYSASDVKDLNSGLPFEMPGYTLSCQNQTYRALGNRATAQL